MPVDLKQFLPYVEHCDLTEAQKLELLADLWSILECFADDAWGVVPKHDFANDNEQFSRTKPLNTVECKYADNTNEPTLFAEQKCPRTRD